MHHFTLCGGILLDIQQTKDKLSDLLDKEIDRQKNNIELIASENFVSDDILYALGTCFTNKYSEGYPTIRTTGNKGRYYGGCENVDEVEQLCCDIWLEVFNAKNDYHVNVQPHSGSQANMAAYMSVLTPGDTILSMSLDNGGHLTHGASVNFSGKLYKMVFYNVDNNGFIDYDDLADKIKLYHPNLVLAGASAYSRMIDFERIYNLITDLYNDGYTKPYFMVDMSHIAGLIATGNHYTPFGYADIITTTTHKTLRGPRGGMIFCKKDLAKKVDSAVFPGTQGGPLQNVIFAKAVCGLEAMTDSYKVYIHQVVKNACSMAAAFKQMGYNIITGGTDNHLFLIDFSRTHPTLSGKAIQEELDQHGITVNKNCVPNEHRSPMQASGIRIGTPAMTTKGWKESDFIQCAKEIDKIIKNMR